MRECATHDFVHLVRGRRWWWYWHENTMNLYRCTYLQIIVYNLEMKAIVIIWKNGIASYALTAVDDVKRKDLINLLAPSDVIWQYRFWSILVQVMAWWTAPILCGKILKNSVGCYLREIQIKKYFLYIFTFFRGKELRYFTLFKQLNRYVMSQGQCSFFA